MILFVPNEMDNNLFREQQPDEQVSEFP